MPPRPQLKWLVPSPPWKTHLAHTNESCGATDFYAGVEAERIVRLWFTLQDTAATARAGYSGSLPKKNEKKESGTPLEDQEKVEVHSRFNADLKEQLSIAAEKYDVHQGVLLGYILREYYETDGWGYSIEAAKADATGERKAAIDDAEEDDVPEVPYGEAEKAEWITDRLRERIEASGEERIHAKQIEEVVERAGAASRVKHYRDAALDKLGYVHHPDASGVYISNRVRWDEYGVGADDPAIYRKPYDALTFEEKVEGIKAILSTRGVGMPVEQIHEEIFDGNGCTKHIGNLAKAVAQDEAATFNKTGGGTKILRVAPCGYRPEPEQRSEPEPEPESDSEPVDESPDTEDDSTENESEIEDDADDRMEQLMNARPARTDGGTEQVD